MFTAGFCGKVSKDVWKKCIYPFGTDNNGVATERLVEKMKKISAKAMPRDEFVKICYETVNKELKPQYVNDMKRLGLSCDFNLFYDTINEHSQRISQRSFIELYEKGLEYRKDAPTMWCPKCETGISQVECEDKELDSFFNDIVFKVDGEELIIATTRPELLPACVAVFYHPDDARYQKYKGKMAKVPLFDFEVPIMPDPRADPEKGTGIVMCCTFGDQTDMEWQKAHDLPIKLAISTDGKMTKLAGKYEGMSIQTARKMIIEDMKDQRLLLSQEPIKHAVNVHERCGTEIEFMKAKQWFISYLDKKEDMLKWGAELNWYPKHMKSRYDHWVKGLAWDWMISRQRFFGVPFPVWYCKECDEVILADKKKLPVDPIKDKAPLAKCPKCGCTEFVPEKDVMDTWATSSLTPQIAAELIPDKAIQKKIYPMSLRPQAHDIITFWLFNTVVKSRLHNGINPWADVMIAGHAQDPHGKKMSKSKGNVVEPQVMIDKYSADSLRFWAAGSKLGDDLPFQEKDLVTGEKFITKIWNASKFAFMHLEDYDLKKPKHLEPIDGWIISKLNKIIKTSTEAFNSYEYSKTKQDVENFFWHDFCDNYLEIVKDRLYNPDLRGKDARISGQYGLYHSLLSIIKLMAPIMPYITEELYQLFFKEKEKAESVHIASWPKEVKIDQETEKIGDLIVYAVSTSRRAKSEKNLSLKTELKALVIRGKIELAEFELARGDIISAARALSVEYQKLDEKSEADFEHEIVF
ncbi:MAG: valine--tRNA ligase [Nanoarchaeota archaeon]|nr:valine--tRNA ligase [Nanoarchaeota archaeon]